MTKIVETQPSTSPADIVVATANPGKLAELRRLLGEGYRVFSAAELGAEMPEETGETFAENAALKAQAVSAQTGKIAIADDSGLEVSALGGAPGVRTARYAGPGATDAENRAKLLEALGPISIDKRQARFVSVIAIVFPGEETITACGTCNGVIAFEERGERGFGYDSVFQTASGKTMAEMDPAEKNAISHRGEAMRAARHLLSKRIPNSWSPAREGNR